MSEGAHSVLITGASGYIGSALVALLAEDPGNLRRIVALDIREVPNEARRDGVQYVTGDIRDRSIEKYVSENEVDTVVHLAAIVSPGKGDTRKFEYSVDVLGTRNILEICLEHGTGFAN